MPSRPNSRSAYWLQDAAGDLRLAVRGLVRAPGFAVAAIATLALGIGASAATFSVAYGVSFRPLPYPSSDRLVRLYETNTATAEPHHDVSVATFAAWRSAARSVSGIALYSAPSTRSLASDRATRLVTMSVSPAFFDVLGVALTTGPGFAPDHTYTRFTAGDDVVITHGVWQSAFGGRADVIGQTLTFAGVTDDDVHRVVGVLPATFQFHERVDVYRATVVDEPMPRIVRGWRDDRVVARLAPGATLLQLEDELRAVSARLAQEFPASNRGWSATVETFHSALTGPFGRAAWLLLATVLVVLLLACANVAGLWSVRALRRERDTAVRLALGASQWRLLRLWTFEAAIVAVIGAFLGLALGWSAVGALKASAPAGVPRLDAIAVDGVTLAWAALTTMGATFVFALTPLVQLQRRQVWSGLAGGARPATEGRRGVATARALTMAQAGGTAALVVLAVLLTRSLINLSAVDLGWQADDVTVVAVSVPSPQGLRRPWFWRVGWADRLLERLEATPGVSAAAVTTRSPLVPVATASVARGIDTRDVERWPATVHNVSDDYFSVLRLRLVEGRVFTDGDRFSEAVLTSATSTARGVAIVTRKTAQALWPGQPAVGQTLRLPDGDLAIATREVVGVVDDIRFTTVGEEPALHVFVPWTQNSAGPIRVVIKTTDTLSVAALRAVFTNVEPGTLVESVDALRALVAQSTAAPRLTSRTVATFAGLALVLAAVGVYGMLAAAVAARTREIGVRVAIGATRARVAWLVVSRALLPAGAGAAAGLAAAAALARAFRALLFHTEPADPLAFGAGAAAVLVAITVAALGPIRRACTIDPATALRDVI